MLNNRKEEIANTAIKGMDEVVETEQIVIELMRTYIRDKDTWKMLRSILKHLDNIYMILDSIYDTI